MIIWSPRKHLQYFESLGLTVQATLSPSVWWINLSNWFLKDVFGRGKQEACHFCCGEWLEHFVELCVNTFESWSDHVLVRQGNQAIELSIYLYLLEFILFISWIKNGINTVLTLLGPLLCFWSEDFYSNFEMCTKFWAVLINSKLDISKKKFKIDYCIVQQA